MIVAGSTSPLLLASAGGYNLTNSLRFRSSASAYLNRTPASAGNRKTWTWSGWVKRGTLGVRGTLFHAYDGSADQRGEFYFDSSDRLVFYKGGVTGEGQITTVSVFRDPSAWYHVVVKADYSNGTSADRAIIYVNNVAQTVTVNATFANADGQINGNWAHSLGSQATGQYFDGYMTEVNFVNGQALTPSSFGQTSASTGVWIPKKFSGTYGTNGFYLKFTDTTSTSTLGTDFSGNSNTWTVNNISLTAGSTYDSMTDVPTLTSATAANYCVLNPVNVSGGGSTITNGNLNTTAGDSGTYGKVLGTFGMTTGKWYWEVTSIAVGTFSLIGIGDGTPATASYALGGVAGEIAYVNNGNKYTNSSSTSYGASYTTNDIIGVAYDVDAGSITFYKNGTSQGAVTGFSGTKYPAVGGYSPTNPQYALNFGQRPFAYTPPTGFVALNTFNLPTPTIGATASTTANKYFNTTLYTGNGTTQSITNSSSMQPDWVWLKCRSTNYRNQLYDAVRGVTKALFSDSTDAEGTYQGVTAFNSNGFSLGTELGANASGDTFVGWQWRASNATAVTNTAGSITSSVSASTTAGFSIVTYTGTGASATVGHGLGVAPRMIILKARNATEDWIVYHSSIGATNYLQLNLTSAASSGSGPWNSTAPTSSVFSLGNAGNTNGSGFTFVAYVFAPVAGYSAFGSYTGNGSTDGTFVYTGFRPRFIMFKVTTTTNVWIIHDTARDTYNVSGSTLIPNASDSEYSSNQNMDILSNGFKLRSSDGATNQSGQTFIYAAFAENPFKYANAR